MGSLYKRTQALKAHGIVVRRANNFERKTNEYGEKLLWVVDLGGQRQARREYASREAALQAAEAYIA